MIVLLGFILDQVEQTEKAATDVFIRWLTIVSLATGILVALIVIFAKAIRPMMKAIGHLLEQADWVEKQMKSNGIARVTGTDDLGLRDALDVNTASTKRLEEKVAGLGARFSEHLDTAAEREAERVARTNEIEQRQRDAISWGLRTMTEFRERLDALDHRDTRQPRIEGEEDE